MLAQAQDRVASLRQSLAVVVGIIAPLVVLQALLAPVYVPILLGDDWAGIAPLVQILCLLAIPTTLWATAAGWLRSNDRANQELFATTVLAVTAVANAIWFGPMGLTALVIGYAVIMTGLMVAATVLALGPVLSTPTRKAI